MLEIQCNFVYYLEKLPFMIIKNCHDQTLISYVLSNSGLSFKSWDSREDVVATDLRKIDIVAKTNVFYWSFQNIQKRTLLLKMGFSYKGFACSLISNSSQVGELTDTVSSEFDDY